MKFNTKIRYALRAMVEIAKADEQTKIFQKNRGFRPKFKGSKTDPTKQVLFVSDGG